MDTHEILEQTLARSGVWDVATNVARGGQDFALPFEQRNYLTGFAWPDGRFRFKPDWRALGGRHAQMPTLPDHLDVIDEATADKPYRLVAAPARTFLNTTFNETPSSVKREREPTAQIHRDTCAALALAEGDAVWLGNEKGRVQARVRPVEGQHPGVVVLEGLWPNKAFTGRAGVNVLTSTDPGFPSGGAVFHDTAIWLRPVDDVTGPPGHTG
ncbi:MAG: molybdopterin dinucleotide binding domain-containing protein [Burkholderiaceae bacterium]